MVTSLMLGPIDDPCQRPVSSHSTLRSSSPALAASDSACGLSVIAATSRTTAA